MTVLRRPGTASAAALLVLVAGVVAARLVAPEWAAAVGLDVWNLPAARAQQRAVMEETEAICDYAERAAARRTAANQCAARLAAGATDLATAADELRAIFAPDPSYTNVLARTHAEARSERHAFALHALDRVGRLLENDPARRAAVLDRLQVEYAALSCGE